MADSAALKELRSLVSEVCFISSDPSKRHVAEERLIAIQADPNSWRIFIDMLPSAEDNLLFFIGNVAINMAMF